MAGELQGEWSEEMQKSKTAVNHPSQLEIEHQLNPMLRICKVK
jgi:hypothetical protein